MIRFPFIIFCFIELKKALRPYVIVLYFIQSWFTTMALLQTAKLPHFKI